MPDVVTSSMLSLAADKRASCCTLPCSLCCTTADLLTLPSRDAPQLQMQHELQLAVSIACIPAHVLSASVMSLRVTSVLSALRLMEPMVPTEVITPSTSMGAYRNWHVTSPHTKKCQPFYCSIGWGCWCLAHTDVS